MIPEEAEFQRLELAQMGDQHSTAGREQAMNGLPSQTMSKRLEIVDLAWEGGEEEARLRGERLPLHLM